MSAVNYKSSPRPASVDRPAAAVQRPARNSVLGDLQRRLRLRDDVRVELRLDLARRDAARRHLPAPHATGAATLVGTGTFTDVRSLDFIVTGVPEPGNFALAGLTALGIGLVVWRRRAATPSA